MSEGNDMLKAFKMVLRIISTVKTCQHTLTLLLCAWDVGVFLNSSLLANRVCVHLQTTSSSQQLRMCIIGTSVFITCKPLVTTVNHSDPAVEQLCIRLYVDSTRCKHR